MVQGIKDFNAWSSSSIASGLTGGRTSGPKNKEELTLWWPETERERQR